MNCKNCKNWVFGRCVISNLVVGPDVLCNAWELSQSYEMVDMQFATFDEEELHKRIMELEYKASDNASSIHAIISVLDINDETQGFSDDMYDTALELAHKLRDRVAELEEFIEGHDPFEEFPPKERGFECSIVVLGKFEYQDEFTPFTNWDLCVYWFDKESWHPLNDYVKGDDIVRWYVLPPEEV